MWGSVVIFQGQKGPANKKGLGNCIIGYYVVGSKSYEPDTQKPRQMVMLWVIYSAIYELLVHRCEKCVEVKGDYVKK